MLSSNNSVENTISIEERNISVFVSQSQEHVLKVMQKRKEGEEVETLKEYRDKRKKERMEYWPGKVSHGQFKRETEELSGESWCWIRAGELK